MQKVVMNLEDYKGKYVMHCPTEESAKLFCDLLYEDGRVWKSRDSYAVYTNWVFYKKDTIYYFNEGMYGLIETAKELGYRVLEIEDFIQDIRP